MVLCSGAVHFIDTWFLDPATRMDPTVGLQYSQEIRGSDQGRGIGIIDAKDLAVVWDSALLLDRCTAFSGPQRAGLQAWLVDYVHWLSTSSHASDEFGQQNNHGTWFDEQAITCVNRPRNRFGNRPNILPPQKKKIHTWPPTWQSSQANK